MLSSPKRILLLLGCSERKVQRPDLLPAVERYDGPLFRIVRRYQRLQDSDHLDVYILSAEYGLIRADHLIAFYDRRMTPLRAAELKATTQAYVKALLDSGLYDRYLVCMGAIYREALGDCGIKRSAVCAGSLGKMQAELWEWLYGATTPLAAEGRTEPVRIRGCEIRQTSEEIMAIACAALANNPPAATQYQAWCVSIDNQPVSPKWLISELTGLPVSSFGASDARRVLTQLGIPVVRVNSFAESYEVR